MTPQEPEFKLRYYLGVTHFGKIRWGTSAKLESAALKRLGVP
jgi:hypothetical protein